MNLGLSADSLLVKEMFERFFATESTPARVRTAEPVGFDPVLWRDLVALDAPFMRMPAASGDVMSLFDACLVMEEAGRRLASAPLAESIVALRVLGELGGQDAQKWVEEVRGGKAVLTLALRQTQAGETQLVPGGAVARGVLTFDGHEVAIEVPDEPLAAPSTLGGAALGLFDPGKGQRHVIASGAEAANVWASAIEEWKILTSAALVGLSDQAISMGAAYSCERYAFGQPIGAYQGIAHPLATSLIDTDGARLHIWWTLRALADGAADAGANISMLFWWASRTATNAVACALHTFGGYGLTNEYDIQLYHRRAKAWALAFGDPRHEMVCAGRRLLLGEATALPKPGPVEIDFLPPPGGESLAAETRAVFDAVLDTKKHILNDHSFAGHAWDVHRELGQAGLLFPQWPEAWGGRDADADAARASRSVWREVGYSSSAAGSTDMIGAAIMQFGQPELKEEVLRAFARGEATASLGYTEPSAGSDVFAAKTRAVRDGDDWIITGQKMFTSGANIARYVFLIARTDPDAPKHKGITMFLVPLDSPGVEIHPVHTFMDERTNATFYSDVRVPDRYRIGDINGGVKVMSFALSLEQGGGGGFEKSMREMVDAVADWARRTTRDGRPVIEDPQTLARLARVHLDANISAALSVRVLATRLSGQLDLAYGPAAKVFCTEAFITDAADLLDLSAPNSLLRGKAGLGLVEMGYRHSTATTIYGGTSEVLRSMVAEKRLGLPRSRA